MTREQTSRTARWQVAVREVSSAVSNLEIALDKLLSIQVEYASWRDNLPANLIGSALAEKLDAVVGIDLWRSLDSVQEAVGKAEQADLPLDLGRD